MVIIKKEKQLKEVEITVEYSVVCDKCDLPISIDSYDAFDFTFEVENGNKYPEGGDIVQQNMDLCKKCSEELLNYLKNNNYRINTKDISW